MTSRLIIRPALALTMMSTLLAGCAETHRGFEAISRVGSPLPASTEEADTTLIARPDIKTVRPRGAPRTPATDTSLREPETVPTVVATAVPSPRDIFDFHPPGSAPGSFRQPFIIDSSDGPLRAEVQHSAKELHDYMAGLKTGTQSSDHKRCSETDVATAKPGCVTPATKAATAAARNTTTVQ